MRTIRLGLGAVAVTACLLGTEVKAQDADLRFRVDALEKLVAAQARRLAEQERALTALSRPDLGQLSGAGVGAPTSQEKAIAQVEPASPGAQGDEPSRVGQAPPERGAVEVAALPERQGVLTPHGQFVLEPSMDYTHASTNRLVFRGVEIVTGVQIGVIEASDADRNGVGASLAGRYGLSDRLEVQMTVPYVRRADRLTTLAQRDETISRSLSLKGSGLGDVELGVRYQINRTRAGRPVFIGALRVKGDTGTSPFEIDRDEFGVARRLATGSGFWAVEPGLTFLYPTDPIVIFGGASYLYHMPRDIDRTIGEVRVGKVDPGDAIGVNAGFGFAINPKFSFSLGYRHSYILPTKSRINGVGQKSESLQVGVFAFGWSLRLNDRMTLSNGYEFGATSDAPDVRVALRLPYRF
ncbi:MAG TPA: transporter [Caulobacter sp.]|nr:transporter [Caulobacter sp.]